MAIPEKQLNTWSNIGAGVGSAETYQQVKAVLESTDSPYAKQQFKVFLQGSYGNKTNIWSESDVDIVIELESAFIFDTDLLPYEQKALVRHTLGGGVAYGVDKFKYDVYDHLHAHYGTDAVMGKRAINIKANGNRRSADVIVSMGYKELVEYTAYSKTAYHGILFKDTDGNEIVNYPEYHSANCTAKNKATANWFKPTVRIFKNMRGQLIANGLIADGDAPSYFIEGMLWNVPNDQFGGSYQMTVDRCIKWLNYYNADKLLCANEMYPLLHPESSVTWRKLKFSRFLDAAINLWENW